MNENLIDQYLLNLLTEEEKKTFEIQLDQDESLKKELLEQQEIMESIEGLGRIQLKSELKVIHNKLNPESKKSSSNIKQLLFRIASAAVFIGFLSLGWMYTQQAPSNSELYAQNFEPFNLSLVQRSSVDEDLAKIESLYVDGKYNQAIPLFETALNGSEVKSSQILLGLGISLLQTNKPTEAISYFNTILANKDFNYEDEAQWYLGLSYLKLNDDKKAKSYLEPLAADTKRDHHNAAKKLISKLK